MACFEFILLLAVGAAGAASLYQELPGQRMSLTAEQADLSNEHDLQDRGTVRKTRLSLSLSEVCETFGATLAEVEDSAENEFLKEVARSGGYQGLWLGGTDMFNEGHFVWAGSRRLIRNGAGFTDWKLGEPNDHERNEDCLHLYRPYGYRWNDAPCTWHQNFACEIK
ncbi:hypothetical protein BaRGS_00034894 [Batillaria attramentaria]|uniref:C-type lectin domain-containing protein n=1 Tax=Batillaria attramentaria TaxID=370345 RepID=A0ABD0JFW9_9CAEN